MPEAIRRITAEDVKSPLLDLAVLDLSDAELLEHGVVLHDRDVWDGWGEYSSCVIELRTGEQFFLRRLDHGGGRLDVLGSIERESNTQLERLPTALDVGRDRVQWDVASHEWLSLRETYEQWRRDRS